MMIGRMAKMMNLCHSDYSLILFNSGCSFSTTCFGFLLPFLKHLRDHFSWASLRFHPLFNIFRQSNSSNSSLVWNELEEFQFISSWVNISEERKVECENGKKIFLQCRQTNGILKKGYTGNTFKRYVLSPVIEKEMNAKKTKTLRTLKGLNLYTVGALIIWFCRFAHLKIIDGSILCKDYLRNMEYKEYLRTSS